MIRAWPILRQGEYQDPAQPETYSIAKVVWGMNVIAVAAQLIML
jgi:hypothetical protein